MTAGPSDLPFRIVDELGRGAFGVVYRVHDEMRGCEVAVKTLHVTDPSRILDIKQEFRSRAGIHHPNLTALFELHIDPTVSYFTMELVDGHPLDKYLAQAADNPAFRAALLERVVVQVLRGLEALHAGAVAHRDIKPSNVLVSASGRAVLADFSLATRFDRSADPEGLMVGTPRYMAPEAMFGAHPSSAADLYALGAVAYEALLERPPWSAASAAALATEKLAGIPGLPDSIRNNSPVLSELIERWLSVEPERRPSATESLRLLDDRNTARPPGQHFVGRHRELGTLATAPGGTFLIVGPAGAGKTALVEHHVSRAPGHTLIARCYPGEHVPFNAVDGWVDGIAAAFDGLGGSVPIQPVQDLATLFPILESAMKDAEADAPRVEPRAVTLHAAREALVEIIRYLGRADGVRLWIDDFQWADEDSLAFVQAVVRSGAQTIVSMRLDCSVHVRDFVNTHFAQSEACMIELGGLSSTDVCELAVAHDRDLSNGELTRLHGDTAGNPFLVQQVLSHDSAHDVDVRSLVRDRVARLPPAERRVMELISIANAPLDRRMIHRMSPTAETALQSRSLTKLTHYRNRDALAPAHARLAEYVIGGLEERQLRDLHRSLATALENLAEPPSDQLVHHWRRTSDRPRVAHWAEVAGDEASAQSAWRTATSHYEAAIEHQAHPAPVSLLRRLAEALSNGGQPTKAAKIWLQAAEGSESADDYLEAAAHLFATGAVSDGIRTLTPVAQRAGVQLHRSTAPMLANAVWWRLRTRVRGLGWQARTEAEVPAALRHRADLCWTIAAALGIADARASFAVHCRHVFEALETGIPDRIARALATDLVYLGSEGRRTRHLSEVERAIDEVEPHCTDGHVKALVSVSRGYSKFLTGELRDAAHHFGIARARYGPLKINRWEAGILTRNSLWLARMDGSYSDLSAALHPAITAAHEANDWLTWMQLTFLSVDEAMIQDDVELGERRIREARRAKVREVPWSTQVLDDLSCLTLDIYAGRWRAVRHRLQMVKREWRGALSVMHLRAQLLWFDGLIALSEHSEQGRRRTTRRAAQLSTEIHRWPRALAAMLSASVAHQRDQRASATSEYLRAIELFERAGFRSNARAARLRVAELAGEHDAVEAHLEAFRRAGVGNPRRYVASLAPGTDNAYQTTGPGGSAT